MAIAELPFTPDGRYIVLRGRPWRRASPALPNSERQALMLRLMRATDGRSRPGGASDAEALALARAEVDAAKVALGERGPVWWDDGAIDFNCRMARTTSYADLCAATEVSRS